MADGTAKLQNTDSIQALQITQLPKCLQFANDEHNDNRLSNIVVCRKFRHTTQHGAIEGKTQTKIQLVQNLHILPGMVRITINPLTAARVNGVRCRGVAVFEVNKVNAFLYGESN